MASVNCKASICPALDESLSWFCLDCLNNQAWERDGKGEQERRKEEERPLPGFLFTLHCRQHQMEDAAQLRLIYVLIKILTKPACTARLNVQLKARDENSELLNDKAAEG